MKQYYNARARSGILERKNWSVELASLQEGKHSSGLRQRVYTARARQKPWAFSGKSRDTDTLRDRGLLQQ